MWYMNAVSEAVRDFFKEESTQEKLKDHIKSRLETALPEMVDSVLKTELKDRLSNLLYNDLEFKNVAKQRLLTHLNSPEAEETWRVLAQKVLADERLILNYIRADLSEVLVDLAKKAVKKAVSSAKTKPTKHARVRNK